MSLTLNLGGRSVDLTSGGDLVKFLASSLPGELNMLTDPANLAGKTLSDIGAAALTLTFSTTKQLSWDLGTSGSVTFGFSPRASGAIAVQTSGTLFTYKLGDQSDPVDVSIPEGAGYISITLNVSLGVSGGAAFSSGNFGVSANASAQSTFAVSFRKAFPLSTDVLTAILQTFNSFTFPFQPASVAQLHDGDYLDYEYLGSIKAGFGVSYGVSGNLLGGRSVSEISRSFDVSPLAKAVVNVKPSFHASASFAFEYDHADVFRVIVARETNAASVLYFRSASNTVTTTEKLGITLNAGASFDLSSNLPAAAGKFASSAVSGISGALGTSVSRALSSAISNDVSGQVQQYIADVNRAINGLLSKGDGHTIQLQFQQERLTANTALFGFEFDLTQADALSKGYPLAISGDFANAVQVAGVTLDPGGFIENTWVRAASVSFQFFDLFKASDVVQYFRTSRLVYAGNNVFRLIYQTGVLDTVTVNSAQNSCEVFFTASAPATRAAVITGDLDVNLNFRIIDHTSDAAKQTKRALIFIGGAALQNAAAAIPDKLSGLTVTCRFAQNAFSTFDCDAYIGGKPSPLPHPIDAANYSHFIAAVNGVVPPDNINHDFLKYFGAYDSWVEFNRVKVDRERSAMTPDRHQSGNSAVSVWPESLDIIDSSERILLECYVYAAQSFMNLCEALNHLGNELATTDFKDDFGLLMNALNNIINQNIPVFFIKPALAALFRASKCSSSDVAFTQSGSNFAIDFLAATAAGTARVSGATP